MLPDEEGFLQPVVDAAKCVGCGKCEVVCPVLHPGQPRTPLATYAAKANDDELRRMSSSGGVFSLLARQVIAKGGTVYGAAFEKGTHRVIHQTARNEEELDALRGSKYVQSDMGDTFAAVKSELEAGQEVLFSGCPCQVAGLKNFLGRDWENLLTIEVICHAAGSPLAWEKYLSCQERMLGKKIARTFSRRNCDWRKYALSLEVCTSSDNAYLINPASRSYLNGFGWELFSRKSCYNCPSRAFKSGADITIGDYWGVETVLPDMDDGLGTSAVMVLSEKGLRLLDDVRSSMETRSSDVMQVARVNKTLFGNHRISSKRDRFFAEVTDTNFDDLVERLTRFPLWYRVLRWVKWHTIGKPEGA